MKYDIVIGCEIHVQLNTKAKAFCGCENRFGGEPNSRVCPVCLGLPGSLPVPNREMIDFAIKAGKALGCSIARMTKFDRKNFTYPDMPKAYQISQFDMPICSNGFLEIKSGGSVEKIRITRIHMEEDAGKNIHSGTGDNSSYVDYNRSGTPLLEIVSEPDIRSPELAVRYVQAIREIMLYLGISDCNMEEGSLRCDANINLWVYEDGKRLATPIAEIKNMNSFKAVNTALSYEVKRQCVEWEEHRRLLSEEGKKTRGFDEATGRTILMRFKEEASDYRYFPEPDIKPIHITPEYVETIFFGELPDRKRKRFSEEYGLPSSDIESLLSSKEFAEYFERAVKGYDNPKKIANWMLSEVKKALNAGNLRIVEFPVPPEHLGRLLKIVDSGTISSKIAKQVFGEMIDSGRSPEEIVDSQGLQQMGDSEELKAVAEEVVRENESSVKDYVNGKEKALKFLMGQVMKKTGGKANPRLAENLLKESLRAFMKE